MKNKLTCVFYGFYNISVGYMFSVFANGLWNRKYGNTIIMVTHNEEISKMADHTIKLRDGKVRKNIINDNKVSAEDLEW